MAADVLYLECESGISGDLLVAALLDLGAPRAALDEALASLPLAGFTWRVGRVRKNGLDACDFDVLLDDAHRNHDHDMAWLHGHDRPAEKPRDGEDGPHGDGAHGHPQDADAARNPGAAEKPPCADGALPADGKAGPHGDGAHGHGHGHRTLGDVLAVIDGARLAPGADALARRAFRVLARGEAAAHGTAPELVHFHEVGAVDSIVDVVAASVCLDALGVRDVVVGDLAAGYGTVRCAHGVMPVPVPAVVNIAVQSGLVLRPSGVRGELVTPTGAALAAAARTRDDLPARHRVARCGLGAGKRTYEGCSGVLRAFLLEDLGGQAEKPSGPAGFSASPAGTAPAQGSPAPGAGDVAVLETDIDDCSGETLGRLVDALLAAGAHEAHYLPVFTKKNRPAWQLQVVCPTARADELEALVFAQTTTIGVRRYRPERTALPRTAVTVPCELGELAAKRVMLPDGRVRVYPEHDAVAALADAHGLAYPDARCVCQAACLAAERAQNASRR
jgi:hypothetical protein